MDISGSFSMGSYLESRSVKESIGIKSTMEAEINEMRDKFNVAQI